ncbi:MAG: ISL3 family transposase [Dehalococcoidia bacterium]
MTTNSRDLYATILGLREPWQIEDVVMDPKAGEVRIRVALPEDTRWVCPECLAAAPIHDHQERRWRHLDTCQFQTIVQARVPRLNCPTHGIKQLVVPWAEPGSRFTAMFEALAIDWLKEASIHAVAKLLRLSWDEAAGVQHRAVRRGLARRKLEPLRHVGVDETAFQKRHEYVTVVTDLDRHRVIHVADNRTQASLADFWSSLPEDHRAGIEAVAMDLWAPYIQCTMAQIPDAELKIVIDKYHVATYLNRAVDEVRRQEHRRLTAQGDASLKGTKYAWLRHPGTFSHQAARWFAALRRSLRPMARAWEIKEAAMKIFELRHPGVAERNFRKWYRWAIRSRLEPIKRVARMLSRHWPLLRNYFEHPITNAGSESMNAKIQKVKRRSNGFRNRDRFRDAIFFHCGGLDLYPARITRGQ